jgi:CRP-like cAMP-binding protein
MAIFAGTPTPFGGAINAGQDHVYSGARHLPQGPLNLPVRFLRPLDQQSAWEGPMTNSLRLVTDPLQSHPFVLMLNQHLTPSQMDIDCLREAIECERLIRKKRDIVVEGYECRELYIVERGFAIAYKLLRAGRRQVLNVVLPGEIIGLPGGFFDRSAYSVTSLTDMKLQVFKLKTLVDLCDQRPNLSLSLLWFSAHQLAIYAEHISDVGRRTPIERVAHFLLEIHARLIAVGCATEKTFEMPLSQELIGDLLGLSAPHVNRMLHQLRSEHLITMGGHSVTINDADQLQFLGQFQHLTLKRIPIPERRRHRLN